MRDRRSVLLASVLLAGCPSEPAGPDVTPTPSSSAGARASSAATASGATTAAAVATTAPAPQPDTGPPVCTRSNEKVWSAGANKLAGLTTKWFKGTQGIGFAIGAEPRVLVIERSGEAKVMKVKVGTRAKLADPKEGQRKLMRVSPRSIEGEVARAFVDYRDEFKDKRRRVYCGPAEADEAFLEYEGTSWLDLDPKPEGEEKKKLFAGSEKKPGYSELRDCRTFVTLEQDEAWALGSVLRGTEKPDGTNEWKAVFVVDFGKSDEEVVLHEAPLKSDPPKIATYEIPISRRIRDKGFLIATRFSGSLLVGMVDEKRKPKGKFKSYPGYPTMPDIGSTKEELIVMTGIGAGKEKAIRGLVINRETLELPAAYTDVPLSPSDASGDAESSFSAPELSQDSKGQRWLAYVEGPRDKGQLRIVPVDAKLAPMGRALALTSGDVHASEVRVFALDDGRLMATYIRESAGKVEVVSEQLACEAKK
jgi:hypothetical protein